MLPVPEEERGGEPWGKACSVEIGGVPPCLAFIFTNAPCFLSLFLFLLGMMTDRLIYV
jgi:hypothetical protein